MTKIFTGTLTSVLLRRPMHILMAVMLAVGLSASAASQSEAGRSGRIIAGAIIGGIAAAAIISAQRRHGGYYYRPYAYAGSCYRGPRRCAWRRHCSYNRWGERRCHRHRKCWRPRYCD